MIVVGANTNTYNLLLIMNNITELIMQAKIDGVASEEKLWKVVGVADNILNDYSEDDKKRILCELHNIFYGPHFDASTAIDVVKDEHLRIDDVKRVYSGKYIYDAYVAYNTCYSMFKGKCDAEIIDIANEMFLKEPNDGKIWKYIM